MAPLNGIADNGINCLMELNLSHLTNRKLILSYIVCLKYCFRFDTGTVSLLTWYEAIFGHEMWRNVIVEMTFWYHTKHSEHNRKTKEHTSEEKKRKLLETELQNRFQVYEGKQSKPNLT